MPPTFPRRSRSAAACAVVALALLAGGCDGELPQSALHPAGPAAARIATLWWVMLAIATAVCVLVIVLALWAVLRRRAVPGAFARSEAQDRRSTRWVVYGGIVFPAVTMTGLFFYTMGVLAANGPPGEPARYVIEMVGKLWWWEVRYVDTATGQSFITANELRIPAGEPVELRLMSDNVIHSVWVPQLDGKLDMIPGRTNVMWLEAREPGEYRGQCAEYCGLQHTWMAFWVIAEPPERFAAWFANELRPAAPPADPLALRGQEVFVERGCGLCHAVRGTPAAGRLGPDLTHVALRTSLGAGLMENNRGNMAGWISDPQSLKPGAKMPPVPLPSDELLALLHYMEGLR